jgi:hypothetical protein
MPVALQARQKSWTAPATDAATTSGMFSLLCGLSKRSARRPPGNFNVFLRRLLAEIENLCRHTTFECACQMMCQTQSASGSGAYLEKTHYNLNIVRSL